LTAILEAKALQKRYAPQPGQKEGQLAVKHLDLTIEQGEIFSLLGPNGAGKTTSISMMSGLIAPTAGDVWIGGKSITKEALAVKKLIGVVPQEIALYPELSARANLEFFGKLYGLNGVELAKRCDEVLEYIGLKDRQNERISSYSGGMKRRVNIGVGLLHKPQIVFMDEPTVGIDPQSRRSILDAVKDLNARGMSVLYTTHYMEEAQELSNRVGIFDHGEMIALGTQVELMQKVGERDTILIKVGVENTTNAAAVVQNLPNLQVTIEDDALKLLAARGRQILPQVIKALDDAGIALQSVEVREPNLEAVFLQLTGRALRD
jgi:ABC-2 type transport system ATP-binding protein